jgi:hypothetical protein
MGRLLIGQREPLGDGFPLNRAAFVQRVAAALAAGETSVLGAIAVAQRGYLSAPPVATGQPVFVGVRRGERRHFRIPLLL